MQLQITVDNRGVVLQIEQPVAVQIQLRRPSDGAVSESRAFEFLPLDPGRAYWSAKRLKTNYSVFSQILTRDQQQQQQQPQQPQQPQQQQELKHKVPLSRAPVMAGVFATPGAGADSEPSGDTAGAGAGAGQALVWRTVRVTIHCHSRGFSQVRPSANQRFGRFYVLHCSVYDSWRY